MSERDPVLEKTVNISEAMQLAGVTRRTIYNWLDSGKVQYVRTAGGSIRIFAETLFRQATRRDPPAPAL